MKPATAQKFDTLVRENLGTVVRQSTAEQRQAFLERIYGDYEELQKQRDEVIQHKWNLDADILQSHQKEIHDLLFEQTDVSDSVLGDWDTWERVETLIKHTVYARPANFSTSFPQQKGYLERIEVLNKALVDQRVRMDLFNSLLNQQHQEILAWKNLLLLKEREIRTLRNQNNTFSLETRHAKREVSRIRGTKLMVEEDELLQDFKILLSANKELEKENANLRAKMYDKYGSPGLSSSLQLHFENEAQEAARLRRSMEGSSQDGRKKKNYHGVEESENEVDGRERRKGKRLKSLSGQENEERKHERSLSSHDGLRTFPSDGYNNMDLDFWSFSHSQNSFKNTLNSSSSSSELTSGEEGKQSLAAGRNGQKGRKERRASGGIGDESLDAYEDSIDLLESTVYKKARDHDDSYSLSKPFKSFFDSVGDLRERTGEDSLLYREEPGTRKHNRNRRRISSLRHSTEGHGINRRSRSSSVGFLGESLLDDSMRKDEPNKVEEENGASARTRPSANRSPPPQNVLWRGLSEGKEERRSKSAKNGISTRKHSFEFRRSSVKPDASSHVTQQRKSSGAEKTQRPTFRESGNRKTRRENLGKKDKDRTAPLSFTEWKEAVSNRTVRAGMLNAAAPVSAALIKIKKANMALERRMEQQCENMLELLDYDANSLFLNAELHFTVPEFAFAETGSFIHYSGFHTKSSPPGVMMAWHVGMAHPSRKKNLRRTVSSKGENPSDRKVARAHGSPFVEESAGESSSFSTPSRPRPANHLPSPFPVQKLSSVRALGFSSSRHAMYLKYSSLKKKRSAGDDLNLSSHSLGSMEGSPESETPLLSFAQESPSGGTSLATPPSATPGAFDSSKKSWNSLKQGILGIAALSRAACLKREALHVLQLRQKIAFQRKQMDRLGLKGETRGLLTPLLADILETQSSSSLDEWEKRSTSEASGNQQEKSSPSPLEEGNISSVEMEEDEEVPLFPPSSSEKSSLRDQDVESSSKSISPQSSTNFQSTNINLHKLVRSSFPGSSSSSMDKEDDVDVSLPYIYPQTSKMRSLNASISTTHEEKGENPRLRNGVLVVDRGVGPEWMVTKRNKQSEWSTGTESEGSYNAETGRRVLRRTNSKEQEVGRKKHRKYTKIGSVVHMVHCTSEEEEATMRRHNIQMDRVDVDSYFSSEGGSTNRGRDDTPAMVRGKKIDVAGRRHDVIRPSGPPGFGKAGKMKNKDGDGPEGGSDQDKRVISLEEEEEGKGNFFYHRFMKLLQSKDSGACIGKVFQLLYSELTDLRLSTADIKQRHLEMYNEIQELLSLLRNILGFIDVAVAERVQREVNASIGENFTQSVAGSSGRRRMPPFESLVREVAESAAQDKVSALLSQYGISLDLSGAMTGSPGEMMGGRAPQSNSSDWHKRNGGEMDGEGIPSAAHTTKRNLPHLNEHDLTDDEWVAQHLVNTAVEAVKHQVQSSVRAFVSSPVYHHYVGYPEREAEGNDRHATKGKPPHPLPAGMHGRNPAYPAPDYSTSPANANDSYYTTADNQESKSCGPGGAHSFDSYAEDKNFFFKPESIAAVGESQANRKAGKNLASSPYLSRLTNDLVRFLLAEHQSENTAYGGSEEGNPGADDPSKNLESNPKRPRHIPISELMIRVALNGNADGLGDDETEGQPEISRGPVERTFHHIVQGEKLHINSPHPLAGLFPALFYDQETSIDGSWRRIPIGFNAPKVKSTGSFFNNVISANTVSTRALSSVASGKDFSKIGSKAVLHMLRELQPHFTTATEYIRPRVFSYFVKPNYATGLDAAKQQLSNSFRHILSDEFTDFVEREILPIAQKAQEFSSASSRVETSVKDSLRQLRQADEERGKKLTRLLLRRVATNIRMRAMLSKPRYRGSAFVDYIGLLYKRWRSQQWKKEAALKEERKAAQLRLLETLDLARRPSPYDRHLLSPPESGERRGRNGGTMWCPGHFQTEKSSYHFEKVHLPFDRSNSEQPREIKRLHESKRKRVCGDVLYKKGDVMDVLTPVNRFFS